MFTLKLITLALLGVASVQADGWKVVPTITEWDYATTTVYGGIETYTETVEVTSTVNTVITLPSVETVTFTSTSTAFREIRTAVKAEPAVVVTDTLVVPVFHTVTKTIPTVSTAVVTTTKFETSVVNVDIPIILTHVNTFTKFEKEPIFRTKTIFQVETDIHSTTVTTVITSYTQGPAPARGYGAPAPAPAQGYGAPAQGAY